MHHLPASLLRAHPLAFTALILAITCGDAAPGELRVILDSSQVHDTLEVIALPFDPASLEPQPIASGPRADSLQRLRALADSAERLDDRFQRERSSINADVVAMRAQDRTSPAYARAEAAMRQRVTAAELLRTERDRTRARMRELGAALGVSIEEVAGTRIAWTQVQEAARRTDHAPISGSARDTVVLRAPPGRWWITRGLTGAFVLSRSTPVAVTSGAQATLRLDAR